MEQKKLIIRNPITKIGSLLAAYLFLVLSIIVTVATLLSNTINSYPNSGSTLNAYTAGITVLSCGVLYLAARFFRGTNEPDAPRPWWRTTSSKAWGILISALYSASAIAPILACGTLSTLFFYSAQHSLSPEPTV